MKASSLARSISRRQALGGAVALFSVHGAFGCGGESSREIPGGEGKSVKGVPALGINLNGPADWNTEIPFADVFHFSRTWISQKPGAGWGKGPTLDLDENGWIRRFEPGCHAETPLCTIEGGHYPKGAFTVLWEGEGRIELSKGKEVSRSPHQLVQNIDPATGGFFLRLKETDPKNPVRNIRVLLPGTTAEAVLKNPWNPGFLKRWKGMACVRFMDFQETNNSHQTVWDDRPRVSHATYTTKGVPVELLCDLANRLHANAWFCIPHLADDDYVRNFARLVNEKLDKGLKAYVEYSNEVWNSQFQQNKYAVKRAQEKKLSTRPHELAWRFTAERSMEIFKIFEEEWKERSGLVRVLPAHSANILAAKDITTFKGAGRHADVLAIAPYISMNIPDKGTGLTAETVAGWTVDQFLDEVEAKALLDSIRWIKENKAVADAHGLRLVAYEAGQHFVGTLGGENNADLTKLLHAANAHPRMETIYQKYYEAWEAAGGDLLCHFSSVSQWSKWGSWGLLQYADEDPQKSPKFRGTIHWAKKLGQQVGE